MPPLLHLLIIITIISQTTTLIIWSQTSEFSARISARAMEFTPGRYALSRALSRPLFWYQCCSNQYSLFPNWFGNRTASLLLTGVFIEETWKLRIILITVLKTITCSFKLPRFFSPSLSMYIFNVNTMTSYT